MEALCVWPFGWSYLCFGAASKHLLCVLRGKIYHFLSFSHGGSNQVIFYASWCNVSCMGRMDRNFIHFSFIPLPGTRETQCFCFVMNSAPKWLAEHGNQFPREKPAHVGTECYRSYKNGPMLLCPRSMVKSLAWIMREAAEIVFCVTRSSSSSSTSEAKNEGKGRDKDMWLYHGWTCIIRTQNIIIYGCDMAMTIQNYWPPNTPKMVT